MSDTYSDPPGQAWDCHAHLFGPYVLYPLAAQRSYTPPEATESDYVELLAHLGLDRGVLVQPSAYRSDYALVLDTLKTRPLWRGVLVAIEASLTNMRSWRAGGIRGLRFSHRSGPAGNFPGSARIEDLLRLAPGMAEAGLHAELWTDCEALPSIAPILRALPVPVVLDHMGGFDHRAGVAAPGFRVLLGLLETQRVWVKLCAYRNLLGAADENSGQIYLTQMCFANVEKLVWGSDWPHLNVTPPPDSIGLLNQFQRWVGDQALVRRVMVDNPGRLYS